MPLPYVVWRELLRPFSRAQANAVNDVFTKRTLLPIVQNILHSFMPDVIVCFQPAAAKTYVLDLQVSVPVVLMCHGDASDWFVNYPPKQVEAIGTSDFCQVLLPGYAKVVRAHFPHLPVAVIGNVAPQYEEQAELSRSKQKYKVLFLGRLARGHKQPHLLVEAFCRIAHDFPNWELELWGATDRKSYDRTLDGIAARAGLSHRVRRMGVTNNVPKVLATGDMAVFPSSAEGFSLAAAEAMRIGLPLVAFRSCASMSELLTDRVTGLLSDDGVASLADTMALLMRDAPLRVRLGQAAREAMRAYAPERIWNRWEEWLKEIVAKGTRRGR